MATKTPLRYPGGKSVTYPYIRELIKLNKCSQYVEPFAGGAGVAISLLLNNDVDEIVLNDYDPSIYAFWYSVINKSDELITLIENTDITIDEWHKQKSIQEINSTVREETTLLKLGFSTLFLNRTNRSGILKAGVIGGKKQSGQYKLDCRFNKKSIINRIQLIASKREKIHLFNLDAEVFLSNILPSFDNALIFLDPPYYQKGPGLYTNFYEHDDHISLSNIIKEKLKNDHWILTYDNASTIMDLYQEFRNIEYYLNYSIRSPKKGIEFMFFSPNLIPGKIDEFLVQKNSPTP